MKPFNFSLASFANEFRAFGYVHIRSAVDPDFFGFAIDQLRQCQRTGRNEIPGRAIKNKKKQYLFEFPDDQRTAISELVDSISALTGLPASKMTISERHIMVYEANAASAPKLHKDRLASQISVGMPLEVSSGSHIALLPHGAREINSLEQAIYSAKEVEPTAKFVSWETLGREKPTAGPRSDGLELVTLDAGAGDVVVFAGSSMYHGRLNAAKSAMLYFKLNALGLDPLGEDP
jgi:hypothetical protein